MNQASSLAGRQFVYILTDGVSVKVGRAANILSRIKAIQCGCPRKIMPVCGFGPIDRRDAASFETELHRAMKNRRISGEWFDCPLESVLAAAFLRAFWFCGITCERVIFANEYAEAVRIAYDRESACRNKNHEDHDLKVAECKGLLSCFESQEVLL
jgi:hypothetical protein